MMKAAVYSSFNGPIEVKSIPRPTLSANDDDSVIVKVLATGVCRSDWHGWKGHDDDIKKHGFPFIPGHELSGIIFETPSSLSSTLQIGTKVAIPFILSCGSCIECNVTNTPTICLNQKQPGFTCFGSFAEYIKIDRAKRNLRIIPNGVSFVEAAALGCRFTTAYRAVVQQGLGLEMRQQQSLQHSNDNSNRINTSCNSTTNSCDSISWLKRKKSIAIFGCGGLGLSCIMIAKAFQKEGMIHSIIAIDISKNALQKANELGATHIIHTSNNNKSDINHQTSMNESVHVQEKIRQYTNGLGVEISIDAAGFKTTCENALYATRQGCKMIQVGLPIDTHSKERPNINMGFVAAKEIEIVGSHGFDANDLPNLLELIQQGRLDLKALIEKEVTLEEGAQVLMNMEQSSPLGMTMITKFDTSSVSGLSKL